MLFLNTFAITLRYYAVTKLYGGLLKERVGGRTMTFCGLKKTSFWKHHKKNGLLKRAQATSRRSKKRKEYITV